MSLESEKRYRLRNAEKIVGYRREISGNMILYSRDAYWWTGRKLEYTDIDEWTGLKDKNGRSVYEWDILNYKTDPDAADRRGVVLWEKKKERFVIRDLEEDLFIPLFLDGIQMFSEWDLKVFSYLFLNPDIQEQLGIPD